jgi:DNA-binding NarL/FixJ family response regulator
MSDENVLIIEDELIIARELELRLKELGCSVIGIAETGRQALQVLEIATPDLVLMDIGLKGTLDGVETAAEIRRRWSVPLIYVTAFADENVVRRAQATQPSGYLVKPFSGEAFRSSVESALNRGAGDREN